MNLRKQWLSCLMVMLLGQALCLCTTLADTNKWIGGATGFWTNGVKWSLGSVPGPGDDVLISSNTSVTVILDTSATVASLTLTNSGGGMWSSVKFTNWSTCLNATNVFVLRGGKMTHYSNTDTNAPWLGNNRVYVVCTNFTVTAGAMIDAAAVGYNGGATVNNGYGPGAGGRFASCGSGGGYGGRGANGQDGASGGGINGLAATPDGPGSGGSGSNSGQGGNGGGAIWIESSGTSTVDGTITANGAQAGTYAGGGSGGGIYLRGGIFTGGGVILANGGAADALYGGGGGGGRIAMLFDQANATSVRFEAAGGFGTGGTYGRPGSLYLFKYDGLMPNLITNSLALVATTNWNPSALTVSNALLVLGDGFQLGGTGPVAIAGSTVELGVNSVIGGCGDMTLSGASTLYMYNSSAMIGRGDVRLNGASKIYM